MSKLSFITTNIRSLLVKKIDFLVGTQEISQSMVSLNC